MNIPKRMKGTTLSNNQLTSHTIADRSGSRSIGRRWSGSRTGWTGTDHVRNLKERLAARFFTEAAGHQSASLEIFLVSSTILTNAEFPMLLE